MSFPPNQDSRYFSLHGFRELLARALALDYSIVPFREFEPPGKRPVLLLRHDLDGPLKGARAMAELEAELGVRATYFVQTAGDFYNPLSAEGRALIRTFVKLGHEVGLHYEAARYLGPDGVQALLSDLRILADLAGEPVRSASQHIPVDGDVVAVDRHVENEAYEPRFTQPPMTYISDSLMVWRQATPHDLLDRRASFQLLTHPETWVGGYRDMADALEGMMSEEIDAVRERYREVAEYYAKLLDQRAERDRQFHERRYRQPRQTGSGRAR